MIAEGFKLINYSTLQCPAASQTRAYLHAWNVSETYSAQLFLKSDLSVFFYKWTKLSEMIREFYRRWDGILLLPLADRGSYVHCSFTK